MKTYFDQLAPDYDQDFTQSLTGQHQRNRVYHYLEPLLKSGQNWHILELNCGTGPDIPLLTAFGHQVTACDRSTAMIETAKSKYIHHDTVDFWSIAMEEMVKQQPKQPYDLVFSNFGGINCIDSRALEELLENCQSAMRPNGHFVAVIMPPFCWWESLYFFGKGAFRKGVRRWNKKDLTRLESGKTQMVYYHSPAFFQKLKGWKLEKLAPIGYFLPPSYLEKFFSGRPQQLEKLRKWEQKWAAKIPGSSAMSDHFLIHMTRK